MLEKAMVAADAVLEAISNALTSQRNLVKDIEEEFGEGAADLGAEAADGAAVAAPADQYSGDLDIAMRESAAAAAAQEGAHIQEAILRSKIEAAQQQVLVVL